MVDHKIVALSIWASVGLIGRANGNIQEYTAVLTTQILNQVLSHDPTGDARQANIGPPEARTDRDADEKRKDER